MNSLATLYRMVLLYVLVVLGVVKLIEIIFEWVLS